MGSRDHSEECETCGVNRGGFNDLHCDCDYEAAMWVDAERVRNDQRRWHLAVALTELGRQLAVGGALTYSFERGYERRAYEDGERRSAAIDVAAAWRPGCQRSAR